MGRNNAIVNFKVSIKAYVYKNSNITLKTLWNLWAKNKFWEQRKLKRLSIRLFLYKNPRVVLECSRIACLYLGYSLIDRDFYLVGRVIQSAGVVRIVVRHFPKFWIFQQANTFLYHTSINRGFGYTSLSEICF